MGDSISALHGMNLAVLSDTRLLIEGGPSMWMWNGPPGSGYGGQMVAIAQDIIIDLTTIGANGVDANPNGPGEMMPDGCPDLHAFLMPGATVPVFVVSLQGATENVAFSGYSNYRKIPIGIPIIGGALAPTAISGWPMPTTTYTNDIVMSEIRDFGANLGTLDAPHPINIASWVPENSRLGMFDIAITNGTADVWLGCGPNEGKQQFMHLVAYNEAGVKTGIETRFEQQTLYIVATQVSGDPEIDVRIRRFNQIEQS